MSFAVLSMSMSYELTLLAVVMGASVKEALCIFPLESECDLVTTNNYTIMLYIIFIFFYFMNFLSGFG